jgi:hypothetical protein
MRARKVLTGIGLVVAVVAAGELGFASVPDSSGLIHGCYHSGSGGLFGGGERGELRVIDIAKGQKCNNDETAITWNQKGQKGDKGDTGATGPAGATGAQGPAGARGASGTAGKDGAPGAPGAPGAQGPAGPAGAGLSSLDALGGLPCHLGDAGQGLTVVSFGSPSANGTAVSLTCQPTAASLLSIAVTPAGSTIAQDATVQFAATGTYSGGTTKDITTSVTWSSSSPSVATISNVAGSQGLATGVGQFQTTISATLGSVTGSTNLSGVCRSHRNGQGQNYQDCSALATPGNPATYSQTLAFGAAQAWTTGGNNGPVSTLTCGSDPIVVVTTTASPQFSASWSYTGPAAGHTTQVAGPNPVCPTTTDPTWN